MTNTANSYCSLSNDQGNFEFLQHDFPELYQQAVQAEKYLYIDSQSSLAKMRLFVELACHELGKHFKLKPPVHGDLYNKIKMLCASGCVETWVIDVMHSLREEGNRSVHLAEVNGHYVAQLSISRQRMKSLMRDVHDLAKYVASKLNGTQCQQVSEWVEPQQSELAEQVAAALTGNRDASFALAEHFYEQLEGMTETGDEKWWNKTIYAERQRDLAYWLEKAHAQGHPQTWLLLANCYATGKLVAGAGRDAKTCFKQALREDADGHAAYAYGRFLQAHHQQQLGWKMLADAAEKGHHESLLCMQQKTCHSDEEAYQAWIEKGLSSNQLVAFTLNAFHQLERYEADPDNEIELKKLRSAMITGTAKRAPGIAFIAAYLDGKGLGNKSISHETMAEKMIATHESLPEFLPYHRYLFKAVCNVEGHYAVLQQIYRRALSQADDMLEQAETKYLMAQKAITEFKATKSVTTPDTIHNLLQQAADAGHKEARRYINTAEGKALLKKTGFTTGGRMQPKSSVQKAKDKKKRKLAKKARRK